MFSNDPHMILVRTLQEERRRRTNEQRSYNPNSAVQFAGSGPLSEERRQQMIRGEGF